MIAMFPCMMSFSFDLTTCLHSLSSVRHVRRSVSCARASWPDMFHLLFELQPEMIDGLMPF